MPLLLQAQLPKLVHYQGVLQNNDGTNFNGTTNLRFAIYPEPDSDSPIWSEAHNNVAVSDGNYEVLLGSQKPLKLSFYEYFLEVTGEGVDAQSPRVAIVGSGYNFRLWFLFAAYTIVWLAIFAYLLSISQRQKKIIIEMKELVQRQKQVV